MPLLLLLAAGATAFFGAYTPPPISIPAPRFAPDNPVELGAVHWLRNLDEARKEAEKNHKPILILFQEVPGCSNCTRFGNQTLSHPLIVEAIETYFVPLCIYNNKGGNDADALAQFQEPAWNNPVVRIVNAQLNDLVLRLPDFRSSWQLVNGIRRALDLTGTAAPAYLDLLEQELLARESGTETATFSMYCFWSGEGIFGDIPGVIETTPGFQDGKEVVRVTYQPALISRDALAERTQPKGIQACSRNEGFKTDKAPKYYLAQTPYRCIPMTALQACRANSLVGRRQSPNDLLSPRQQALLKKISDHPDKKWKNMIGRYDLAAAWEEIDL
jgi:hypothetical protein